MKIIKIFSKNDIYQKFEVLKTNRNKRYKYNQFLVEGVRNINQAIKSNWYVSSFIFANSPEKPLSRWATDLLATVKTEVNYELTDALMQDLSAKEDTSELLAIVEMRQDDSALFFKAENPLLVLFDRPSNHGNLGTIIRSCDALGLDGLVITGHAVDLYAPEVIAASMGSFFKLPVIRMAENQMIFDFFAHLKAKYPGFQVVGTTAHHQQNICDLDLRRPTLLMIGNETDGLCKSFKDACDHLATIPMSAQASASSFNVACAATVLFYEAIRQRL